MAKRQILLLMLLLTLVTAALIVYMNLDYIWKMLYPLKYEELVTKYATTYGNDPYLVTAIMYRESRFDPNALSPKGAIGLMQIMPDTAEWINQSVKLENFTTNDLYKPEVNIHLANWYIANLSKEFNGNLVLILAAYNAGRGNVHKWLDTRNWAGEVHQIKDIPFPETQKFVNNVLTLYQRYLQLYEGE